MTAGATFIFLLLKNKQILVSKQKKIVLYAVSFPKSRSLTVMLFFNYKQRHQGLY